MYLGLGVMLFPSAAVKQKVKEELEQRQVYKGKVW
jgi:hypothetical protein